MGRQKLRRQRNRRRRRNRRRQKKLRRLRNRRRRRNRRRQEKLRRLRNRRRPSKLAPGTPPSPRQRRTVGGFCKLSCCGPRALTLRGEYGQNSRHFYAVGIKK